MMHGHDPMKDALKRRKQHGVDITITVDKGDDRDKNTDLAPKGEMDPDQDADQGMQPDPDLPQHPEQDPDAAQDMLHEMTAGMTDHDKQMLSAPGHKPLSLGNRARMEALAKMKHGK